MLTEARAAHLVSNCVICTRFMVPLAEQQSPTLALKNGFHLSMINVNILSVMLSRKTGLITISKAPGLLSSQTAHRAWSWAEREGARTRPGSLEGSGEGNRTCLDERCCHWSGQSLGLRWGKRHEGGMTVPPGPACSPRRFAPAEGLAFYLEAANP